MKSGKIRMLCVMLVTVLMVSLFALPAVSADEVNDTVGTTGDSSTSSTNKSAEYERYLKEIASVSNAKADIVIERRYLLNHVYDFPLNTFTVVCIKGVMQKHMGTVACFKTKIPRIVFHAI